MKKLLVLLGILFCAFCSSLSTINISSPLDTAASMVSPKQAAEKNVSPITGEVYRSSVLDYFGENAYRVNADASNYVKVTVVDSGQVRPLSSEYPNKTVFSDYAHLSFTITASVNNSKRNRYQTKLLDRYPVSGGDKRITRLNHRVHRGVMFMDLSRDGDTYEYHAPIFFDKNKTLNDVVISQDGDYHFFFLLQIDLLPYVIHYTIPVRSMCYVTDETGNLQLRTFGSYTDSIRLKTVTNDVTIYLVNYDSVNYSVTRQRYYGQLLNNNNGSEGTTYVIEVESNYGYLLCDHFEFKVTDPKEPEVYLYNFKRQIAENYYEVEGSLKISYEHYVDPFDFKVFYAKIIEESDPVFEEYRNEITEGGVYLLEMRAYFNGVQHGNSTKIITVFVSAYDSPSFNRDFLAGNRFNNFLTKWLEVYDSTNDEYYCFHESDYNNAMRLAMSIENSKVLRIGGTIQYLGKQYGDEVLLTFDLEANATANVKTVYYDPYASREEKNFDASLFDGTRYLNEDFAFMQKSRLETNRVEIYNDYCHYYLDFNHPISEYDIPDGEYAVKETDLFGNATVYPAIVDRTSPELILIANDDYQIHPGNGQTYTVNYFSVSSFFDAHDDYAVLKINDEYFIHDEWTDALFHEPGEYYVRAYDRNNNMLAFNVEIRAHSVISYSVSDGVASFDLPSHIDITKWTVNGEVVAPGSDVVLSEIPQRIEARYVEDGEVYAYVVTLSIESAKSVHYADNYETTSTTLTRYPHRESIIIISLVAACLLALFGIGILLGVGDDEPENPVSSKPSSSHVTKPGASSIKRFNKNKGGHKDE